MSALPPAPDGKPATASPPVPPAPPAASGEPPVPPAPPRRVGRLVRLLALLVFGLIAIGAALGWWRLQTDLDRMRSQLEQAQREVAAVAEQTAQRERDAQLRFERLADDLTRLREQRAELDQLYLDVTRGRDESALIEVERLVTLAAQELQLSGSVPTALAALRTADMRLARIDRPQIVTLRRAITRDIERLRAAPQVDLTGLALQIDQIIQGVDGWALLAEATPPPPTPPAGKARPAVAKADAKTAPVAAPEAVTWWSGVRAWLKREFGDLVRIREVDTPEALLLNATQQQLVRQQTKLRLLDARTALLMRNDRLYRADLAEVQALLVRYFDVRQSATATAQAQLKLLAGAPLSVDLPQITDSLNALRSLRQGPR